MKQAFEILPKQTCGSICVKKSSLRGEVTPGITCHRTEGRPTKSPAPLKELCFLPLTLALSANAAQFQCPAALARLSVCPFARGGFPIPSHTYYSKSHPLRCGTCHVETAARGTACLRKSENEREGNQFWENTACPTAANRRFAFFFCLAPGTLPARG